MEWPMIEDIYLAYLGIHRVGVLGRELCAVFPISLVAVILLGIMRCSYIDTCNALELSQRE